MIYGHDSIIQQVLGAYERGHLPKSLVFLGPFGVGKYTVARYLLAHMLAGDEQGREEVYSAIDGGIHPDCYIVRRPEDARWINSDQIQGLVEFTQKAAIMGAHKYVIIDALDDMHYTAKDGILKCLEDNHDIRYFLIAHSNQALSSTIASRSHIFSFNALARQAFFEVAKNVLDEQNVSLEDLFVLSSGSIGVTRMLTQPEGTWSVYHDFFALLHMILEHQSGCEQKIVYCAQQRMGIDYRFALRLCENVAAYAAATPQPAPLLGLDWANFTDFFIKIRPILEDASVYHTSWKSVVWGLYGMRARITHL